MFGNRQDILHTYPDYAMTYREQLDTEGHWADTAWSGNAYEFYYWAYNKLQQDVKTPFKLENGRRVDDTPIRQALREVLANCLVNADYHGCGGIVVSKDHQEITLSNPGSFRVPLDTAKTAACPTRGMPRWRGCFTLWMWANTPAAASPTCTASGKPRAGQSRFSQKASLRLAFRLHCI